MHRVSLLAAPGSAIWQPDRMISLEDYVWFEDEAVEGMIGIVAELGDDRANQRPDLPNANSPYAILVHCLGVMAYWGGYIVAGRPIQRDRAAEFVATGAVADVVERARAAQRQLRSDVAVVAGLDPPRGVPNPEDANLPIARTQGGALLHLYEELAQHRGQMEITRDVLRNAR
jgi:hypothetical protein